MVDKKYFVGEFEVVSLNTLNSINKLLENEAETVIFVFKESKNMDFSTKKDLLLFNLIKKNVLIIDYNKFLGLIKGAEDSKVINIDSRRYKAKMPRIKDYDVPDNYAEYVLDNHLYEYDKIFNSMKLERYRHSVSVAKTAVEICKSNGINPKKAFIASILHDVGKDISKDITIQIMAKNYQKYTNEELIVFHQFTGEYIARKLFKIRDRDILNAIKYHTTGYSKMGLTAKIVYASDKIEPTRGYDSKFMIDACKEDAEAGFNLVFYENIKFLAKNKVKLDSGLVSTAIESYLGQKLFKEILNEIQKGN